jgi:hexokinase
MISGMYLGELVRLTLLKLARNKVIFGGKVTKQLETWDIFSTKFLSDIDGYVHLRRSSDYSHYIIK